MLRGFKTVTQEPRRAPGMPLTMLIGFTCDPLCICDNVHCDWLHSVPNNMVIYFLEPAN